MPDETRCASCGTLLPPEPGGVTVFCSARCYGRSVARAQEDSACPNDCGDHCAPTSAFDGGACVPDPTVCTCMCHQPGGMAVSHMVACCDGLTIPPGPTT